MGTNGYSAPLLSSSLHTLLLEACTYFLPLELGSLMALLTRLLGTLLFLDLHLPNGFRL